MYTVIYTKSLENASDLVAQLWEYENHNDALALFKEKVNELVKSALDNEFIDFRVSMQHNKAIIRFESTHHCIAVVKDGGVLDGNAD